MSTTTRILSLHNSGLASKFGLKMPQHLSPFFWLAEKSLHQLANHIMVKMVESFLLPSTISLCFALLCLELEQKMVHHLPSVYSCSVMFCERKCVVFVKTYTATHILVSS